MEAARRRVSTLRDQICAQEDVQAQPCASKDDGMLQGQVALITGAGNGIGAATAALFAQHGAKVVLADVDRDKCEQMERKIRGMGGESKPFVGDLMEEGVPKKLVEFAVETYGGIDILVNNAGFTWDAVLHKTTKEQWETMMHIHCTVPFLLVQAAEPYMRGAAKLEIEGTGKAKSRCILNVSSTSGTHGNPGQANYSTAKMGVVGLTKTIAKEWGPFNVRCNALVFGLIGTRLVGAKSDGNKIQVQGKDIQLGIPGAGLEKLAAAMKIPLGRAGTPEEAAGAMLLMASPYASYISGQALEVTGGGFL
eukprot:scaffold431_cov334-Pavlova_lutheri.AAC.45